MRRLLTYSFLVISISILIALFFYMKMNLFERPIKNLSALDYCFDSREYNDIIFIGGSKVQRHINPAIIDSVNETTSYALSVESAGMVECNLLLNKYLQIHPKPKAVFLNIDYTMFYTANPLYNITDYFPYLEDSLVYKCISPYKKVYRHKYLQYYNIILKVFGTNDKIKARILLKEKYERLKAESGDENYYRGFAAMHAAWGIRAENEVYKKLKVTVQEEGYELLTQMIEKCKRDSIKMVLLFSPPYFESRNNYINSDKILTRVNAIASQTNIPFWNYADLYISQSKNFYYDPVHLNDKGSGIYSLQLAQDIKTWTQLNYVSSGIRHLK